MTNQSAVKTTMLALGVSFAIAAAAAPARASSVTCSTSDGSLTFSQSGYEGGAPPPPDMVTLSETWRHEGNIIGHGAYASGRIVAVEDIVITDQSKKPISTENGQCSAKETYVWTVLLSRKDGTEVYPEAGPGVAAILICTDAHLTCPVP